MLLASTLAPSLGLPVLSILKVLPALAAPLSEADADTELFHRIAVAEQLRSEHARVRRLRDRLRASRDSGGQFYPVPFCRSHPALLRLYFNTFDRYATAVRAAVAVPAHTTVGVHAKLALATIASRRCGARVYMYEDREWLEVAFADLERLVDRERRLRRAGRAAPQDRVPA
jgi:hypothetical protein